MPGRLRLSATAAEIAAQFGAEVHGAPALAPRLEVGPGETVLAVAADAGRRVVRPMRWGLIPMGRVNARRRPVLETIVNARSETLFAKTAYSGLGRCVLPVGGWYEWTGAGRRKTRWTITDAEGALLAFAAVWDVWRAPGGVEVPSLATVTCAPNADVAPMHDRMPAILAPEALPLWLGEADGDPAGVLAPLPPGRLRVAAA